MGSLISSRQRSFYPDRGRCKKRHLEKYVHFVGYTNEPEKYYLNSSVFLLPSRWEGWPMVIMEAFEFGLPVIAYHMGAMDLIIDDGKTGSVSV